MNTIEGIMMDNFEARWIMPQISRWTSSKGVVTWHLIVLTCTTPFLECFHAIRTHGFIFGHKRNIDHVQVVVCLKIKFCDYWNAQATYATNQLKILFHSTSGKLGFIHEVIIQANPELLNFVSNNVIKPAKNHILFIIKDNNKTLINQWSIEMRFIVSLGI